MAKSKKPANQRKLLLQMIEESFRLPNWNETNLRSSLRRVGPEIACWRPRHSKHAIADIAVHCAYWKYSLRRRLSGGKRGGFAFKGSNWFSTPTKLTREQWNDYISLLEEEHEQLCEAIKTAKRKIGNTKTSSDGSWSLLQRVYWSAIHDGYHTGQINFIKAMYRRANSSKRK